MYNILTLDYEPSNRRGGQELSLIDVVKGFCMKGCDVTLGYVVYGNLIPEYEKMGVKTIHVPDFYLNKKGNIICWLSFFTSVNRLKCNKETVIYINQIMDITLAAILKKRYSCKKLICHLRLPPLGYNLFSKFNQVGLFINNIDVFFVATQKMYDLHTKKGIPKEKTFIISNGFWFDEMHVPEHANSNKPIKLTYIGRIDQTKGIHVVIQALKILKNRGIDFKFDIAGITTNTTQEAYKGYLQNQIKEFELSESIGFVGHVVDPIEYLSKYDLTIFSSILDESFGRVVVESILANTPVIASKMSSLKEILSDKECEWEYNNEEDLADLIVQFMNGKDYYLGIKKNVILKKYNLNNIIPLMLIHF
ncbi:MAG: glycosyltransferase [Bacteroidia bacterium]|nr:glycosyltransferase [Bacteroidia bacterium]